jgi:hypothetical protein
MSQPFSRIPEPEIPRPFKRRLQPNSVQQVLEQVWRAGRRQGDVLWRRGQELWRRGRRHPKAIGMAAAAVALTLLGGYTLNASGVGRSMCTSAQSSSPARNVKSGGFLLLTDPVGSPVAGSELEIHYDVCGLSSGAAYRGRLQISRPLTAKKKTTKANSLVITFRDKVDGPATRRHREVSLSKLRPGVYTLELTVSDGRGRERKSTQKFWVAPR